MKMHPVQNETDIQRYNWLIIFTRWQIKVNVKTKCKVYPRTGHGSPEDECRQLYSFSSLGVR